MFFRKNGSKTKKYDPLLAWEKDKVSRYEEFFNKAKRFDYVKLSYFEYEGVTIPSAIGYKNGEPDTKLLVPEFFIELTYE